MDLQQQKTEAKQELLKLAHMAPDSTALLNLLVPRIQQIVYAQYVNQPGFSEQRMKKSLHDLIQLCIEVIQEVWPDQRWILSEMPADKSFRLVRAD